MEPMNLGSPTFSSSSFLPSFLTGESNMPSPRTNTLSPTKRRNLSFASPSPSSSTTDLDSSNLLCSKTLFGQQHQSMTQHTDTPNQNVSPSISGPPTQGLFDSLREEINQVQTPKKTNFNQKQGQNVCGTPVMGIGVNFNNQSFNDSCLNQSNFNVSSEYDLNLSCMPQKYADFWVTVFGFPQNATQLILSHFSQCGSIIDKAFPSQNGNWIHIKYSSRLECDKALSYNEKILTDNIMIGVTRCKDPNIIDKRNLNENCKQFFKIDPITHVAYKTKQCETSVVNCSQIPQKKNGLVDKAMDMLFGW